MSHDTRYLDHEFILVAWKINELRTAQISGHVVLSVFGGLGPLTATEHRFFQRKSSVWLGRFITRRTLGDQLGRRGGWLVTPSEERTALSRGWWNTGATDLLTAEEAFWIVVFSAWGLGRGLFLVSVSFRDFPKPPHASRPASLKPGPDKSSPPCQEFWDLTPANLPLQLLLLPKPQHLWVPKPTCLFPALRHCSGFFHQELFLVSGSFFWGLVQMPFHSEYSQREGRSESLRGFPSFKI